MNKIQRKQTAFCEMSRYYWQVGYDALAYTHRNETRLNSSEKVLFITHWAPQANIKTNLTLTSCATSTTSNPLYTMAHRLRDSIRLVLIFVRDASC